MNVATVKINGFTIKLPIGLPRGVETKVKDGYQDFLREDINDVRAHLEALTTLVPKAVREIKARSHLKVLHCFGGVGATAQLIDQVFPYEVDHTFWERDKVLVEYLRSTRPHSNNIVHVQDSFKMFPQITDEALNHIDVIALDMSVGTIKTPGVKEMWWKISNWLNSGDVRHKGRFVWATDTACAKIHLNYKTYATDFGVSVEGTTESYMNAYQHFLYRAGMNITEVAREAAEVYFVVKSIESPKFDGITYIRGSEVQVN